jgi:hypothetical protein
VDEDPIVVAIIYFSFGNMGIPYTSVQAVNSNGTGRVFLFRLASLMTLFCLNSTIPADPFYSASSCDEI